jgi:hypothetical protein
MLKIISAAVAFLLLHAFVLGANPFIGETVAPVALYKEYAGWAQHEFDSPRTHPERSDVLDAFLPQWLTLKRALRAGENGFWNPLPGVGRVGIPDLTRGALTPSFLLFAVIEADWLAYYFSGLVKLVLASLGTYLLLLRFVSKLPAFFGGITYALCGFNAAWFYWPQVTTAAWIPWLLWATNEWFQTRQQKWIPIISLTTGLLLIGGFPAVSVYGLYASALMVPFLVATTWTTQRAALVYCLSWAGAIMAGILIVSIPLLATLEMLSFTDLNHREGGSPYRLLRDLVFLISPYVDGEPRVEKTLYTGVVALAFALLAVIGLRDVTKRSVHAFFLLYTISLLLLSLAIVFVALPQDWLRAIPAVGTSPWSRFSVLVGLAIAILAALGFHFLLQFAKNFKSIKVRYYLIGLLISISAYQLIDQIFIFRTFNTIAKSDDFIPPTPNLNFVTKNLEGMQSIVADSSYLIGGALGSYGFAEWFAHDFKTVEEKSILTELVSHPFVSPTAAMFSSEFIRYDSELYSKLGIRYVLSGLSQKQALRAQSLGSHTPLPPLSKNRLSQLIKFDVPLQIDAIGFVFATYGKPHASSDVKLEVINSEGHIIASSIVPAKVVKDNANIIFHFRDSIYFNPGTYEIKILLDDNANEDSVTVWFVDKPDNNGDKVSINGDAIDGAMVYSLYKRKLASDGWTIKNIQGEQVSIYENQRVPKGPYFIENLDPEVNWSEENLIFERLTSDFIRINFEAAVEGYVVIPIRFYPGWRASVNGESVPPSRYLGVMPAIPVQPGKPLLIEYKFDPIWYRKGQWMTAMGAFLIILIYMLILKIKLKKDVI